MTEIAINGKNLHEVKMRQQEYTKGTTSYISYPEHRIKAESKGDAIIVQLPAILALELYRSAIIPQNEEEAVTVILEGEHMGSFCVTDLRYSLHPGVDELVSITLKRVDGNTTGGI